MFHNSINPKSEVKITSRLNRIEPCDAPPELFHGEFSNCYFIFFITMAIWVSLHTPRLISENLKFKVREGLELPINGRVKPPAEDSIW